MDKCTSNGQMPLPASNRYARILGRSTLYRWSNQSAQLPHAIYQYLFFIFISRRVEKQRPNKTRKRGEKKHPCWHFRCRSSAHWRILPADACRRFCFEYSIWFIRDTNRMHFSLSTADACHRLVDVIWSERAFRACTQSAHEIPKLI